MSKLTPEQQAAWELDKAASRKRGIPTIEQAWDAFKKSEKTDADFLAYEWAIKTHNIDVARQWGVAHDTVVKEVAPAYGDSEVRAWRTRKGNTPQPL